MNTKNRTIMIILMAILMIVALIGLRLKNDKSENTNVKATGKTLVVYFSAQNHTKNLAEKIAEGDELMMSTIEMVDDFINDPEVISIFHDDSWKIVSAEQRRETKGKTEEKIKTAKNMLKEKCSPKFISKITNLSISEINKLKVN